MCFSATASFTVAGVLIPAGLYTIAKARQTEKRWMAFAVFPLAFGIQQVFEGFVWVGLDGGNDQLVAMASRGFLFFSHFFWLAWVPFAVWSFEDSPPRRRLLAALTVVGFLYGLSIFLPSFLIRDWLHMEIVNRSLDYKTTLIYENAINRTVLRLFYAAIVVSALFLARDGRILIFGGLVTASLLLTYAVFAYAFISVWCFFAAILSAYLSIVILREAGRGVSAN